MALGQVEQGLSSFIAKCLAYFMVFQSFTVSAECSTLKNHQIWQEFGEKNEKSLVQIALNQFLHGTSKPETY